MTDLTLAEITVPYVVCGNEECVHEVPLAEWNTVMEELEEELRHDHEFFGWGDEEDFEFVEVCPECRDDSEWATLEVKDISIEERLTAFAEAATEMREDFAWLGENHPLLLPYLEQAIEKARQDILEAFDDPEVGAAFLGFFERQAT